MTYGEAARIARTTGKSLGQAVDIRPVDNELVAWWQGFSPPHAELLKAGGVGLYLPVVEGACVYLGPSGCSIPQAKPNTCAMFPFSKGPRGWVVGQLVQERGFCFGQDTNAGDLAKTMETFGETKEHLDAVARRAERDTKNHAAQMRRLRRKT